MSSVRIALLACPDDLEDPVPATQWLLQTDRDGIPDAVAYVASVGKFKGPAGVQTINVGTNYPAEHSRLLTLARWAGREAKRPTQFLHSQALVCLRQLVMLHPDLERIAVFRGPAYSPSAVDALFSDPSLPFGCAADVEGESNKGEAEIFVMNRAHPDADSALELALDIALSGAIYGFEPYTLKGLLDTVTRSLALAPIAGSTS